MAYFPIEKLNKIDTPYYYYDMDLLRQTLQTVAELAEKYGFHIHYAVKANFNSKILETVRGYGFGVDCVSGGEISAASEAGFTGDKIMFAGVGKTDAEIKLALETNIRCFNVESLPELENINEIASRMNRMAHVAVRVNPNIDAHTHHYITTGLQENKFGISMELLDDFVSRALSMKNIDLCGVHFHIGSQILDSEPFEILCGKVGEVLEKMENAGALISIIDVGGGLGIDYDNPDAHPVPDFEQYFKIFAERLKLKPGQQLHFEPGRSIVGQCGSLISKVLYVKEGLSKKFAILDAGMNDLLRPALYQAHHKIENLTSESAVDDVYDVVGPVCESSDCFASDERLPLVARGDLFAIRSAGAYGEAMASHYNCRKYTASVFSDEL